MRRNDGIFCLAYTLKNVNSGNFLLGCLKLERDLSEELALLPSKSLVCTQEVRFTVPCHRSAKLGSGSK